MADKPLRFLWLEMGLRAAKALSGLKLVDAAFKGTAKTAEAAAAVVERAADRMEAALGRAAGAAAGLPTRGGGGGGGAGARGGGGSRRPAAAPDPLGPIVRQGARIRGFEDGSIRINAAAKALGVFASATDKARAKVKDLSATVERNKKEISDLRAKTIQAGDADGTLAARMRGLSDATRAASDDLRVARGELRDLEGGFLGAMKKAISFQARVVALGTALGNLAYDLAKGAARGAVGWIGDATKQAIEFESAFADVKKVLPDNATEAQIKGVEKSIVDLSRRVAVDGPEGAAKLTAALVQTGLYADETGKLSEKALARATEFAAKTGVAFDISAGQAGEGLAKLQTSAGLSQAEVESLAGTINHLSNNMAAKAPEILDAATRVGGIGKAAGVSAETMAALSTAMIAAGGTAETAATGTKNFIRAIGAGEAATKKQLEAFHKLGLNAEEVAAKFSKGGREAEAVIRDVVDRIGKVPGENRLATLIQLFGSETIGTIGPLATNIDLLTKSFALATDQEAALVSVQKEYDARSKTTANNLQLLKNNVGAIAIEFGNRLLPYLNQLTEWLTSPEGQKWGAEAAQTAADVVVGLADAIKGLLKFMGYLTENLGGTTVAVGGLALAVAALTGPFGLALAAGVAMGAGIAKALDWVLHRTEKAQLKLLELHNKANAIRLAEQEAERAEQVAESDASEQASARDRRAQTATDAWAKKEIGRRGLKEGSKEALAVHRRSYAMKEELLAGRFSSGTDFDQRITAFEAALNGRDPTAESGGRGGGGGGGGGVRSPADDLERFNQLAAMHKSGKKLRPSEAKELRTLSKRLDLAIPDKDGRGRTHKQTKMDKALAAMNPDVAGVITQGGEEDAGGDAKVATNALDRAVYKRATGGHSEGASLGAGPNIITINNTNSPTITIQVDARGEASTAENLRSAATTVGEQSARFIITGFSELLAAKNGGGRLKLPGA